MNIEWFVSSCAMILLVILARAVFRKKISPRVRYCLWAAVALRLLLPVSFLDSSFSVLNLLPEVNGAEAGELPEGGEERTAPAGNGGSGGALPGEEEQSGAEVYRTEAGQVHGLLQETEETAEPGRNGEAAPLPGEARETVKETGRSKPGLTGILYGVWLAGAGALAAVLLAVNLNYSRRLKRERKRLEPGQLPRESRLPVYQAEQVQTPCLFGLFHPAVYVTEEVMAEEKTFAYVLCHENCHYRHRDNWWALVRALCCCLHWFNPLVWLAVSLSRQDGELACDESALELLGGEQRADYGRALLSLCVKHPSGISGLQLSTTMSGSKRQLKERLQLIVDSPRRAVGALAVLAVLATVILAATFTGRAGEQEPRSAGERTKLSAEGAASRRNPADGEGNPEEVPGESGNPAGENGGEALQEDSGGEGARTFGYNNYTGYLDECTQWTWYEEFVNLDLDGDGRTDRVWRENIEDWALADYRIEFGNGDVAELSGMGGGIPQVRSLDINGDSRREVLFTLSYGFSTDPRAFGENALLMKGEDGAYGLVALPEELETMDTGEAQYFWSLSVMCEPAGETSLKLTVPTLSSAVKLDVVKTFTREEWDIYSVYAAESLREAPAYQVDIVRDVVGKKDTLVLHYGSLLGKWSSDEVLVTLEYQDYRDRLEISSLQYLEYYAECRTVTIEGKEYELTVEGHGFVGEGPYYIDAIGLRDPENSQYTAFIDPEEVSRAYWNTPEDEEAFPVQSMSRDGGVFLADLNFDGYEDLCFQGWVTAGPNIPYYCMLWNPDSESFEYSAVLCNVERDEEEQWISSQERAGLGVNATTYYRYDGENRLHMVRYVEENLSPDAVFERLDLTYHSGGSVYTLPALDLPVLETDEQEEVSCQKLLSMARQALEELYQWTGEKVDTACFQVSNMGQVDFALSPEDMEHSRIFFSRGFGADTEYNLSNYGKSISDISVASAEEVWYSPVSWRVEPANGSEMTDEEVIAWYFERCPLADGGVVSMEQRYEDTWTIQTESGSRYEAVYNKETGRVSAITGPYSDYPEH